MRLRLVVAVLSLLLCSGWGLAKYTLSPSGPIRLKSKASPPKPLAVKKVPAVPDERPVVKALADRYGTDAERIVYWRRLKHGFDEIVPALIVAREAQAETGKILEYRTHDMTWDQICSNNSVDKTLLDKEWQDVLAPFRPTLSTQALTERPRLGH